MAAQDVWTSSKLLERMVSVDWRTPIAEARNTGAGADHPGQPRTLLPVAPPERIAELAIQLIEQAGRDRYIFNLGHGILPDVPVLRESPCERSHILPLLGLI